MKKLLSVIVIAVGITFSGFTYAEAQLLIDRLKTEGMLLPESVPLFQHAEAQQNSPLPLVPVQTDVPSPAPKEKKRSGQISVSELNQLKRKLSKTQNELQALNKKYRALTVQQPHLLAEQTESLKDENKQLQQQLMAAEKQIVDITRRHEKALAEKQSESEHAPELAPADEKIAALTQQISELEARVFEAAKQNALLTQQVKDAAGEKAALEKLKEQLRDSEQVKQQRESELAESVKRHDALISQRDEQSLRITALEKDLLKATEENAQSLAQLAALNMQYKTAKAPPENVSLPAFSLKKNASAEMTISYAFGVFYASQIGNEMKVLEGAGQRFSQGAILQGINDKLNNTLQMSEAEIGKALARLDRKTGARDRGENERHKQKSELFVAQAAKAKGAVKEANGVVYRVMKKGTTPELTDEDVIRFKLTERISTGKVIAPGEIRSGQVGRLPELMQQGVRRVGVGGKVKMTVPWNLAYGDEGIPGTVPPGVASEITLEILGVEK